MIQREFDQMCERHQRGESQVRIQNTRAHKDRGILIKLVEQYYENTDNCDEPVRLSLWNVFPR